MRKFSVLCATGVVCLLSSGVVAQQGKPAPAKPAAGNAVAAPATRASSAPLYRMVNSIQDIMEGIVAPTSDILFDAVATDITAQGVNEKRPQNDEEWEHVEWAAIALVESMNMIRVPGRIVARPGEKTKSEGPDAPELTPEEIRAKIDKDRAKFLKYSNDLQDQAIKALAIARRHDAPGLFDIGEDIDNACESCHLEYWYPNDTAARSAHEANLKLKAAEDAAKKKQGK
jgi:hypothetical protein